MFKLLLIIAFISASNQQRKLFLGGDGKAKKGDFPYHLYLIRIAGKNIYTCSASIISEEWAITAAHCVMEEIKTINNHNEVIRDFKGPPARETFILEAGSVYFNKHGIKIPIKEIIIHPDFNKGFYANNDIALLRFKALQFNKNIAPIELPDKNNRINYNTKATVIGSGYIYNTTSSGQLYHVDLDIKDNEICGRRMGDITDKMICTQTKDKSACGGDSGAPLVQDNILIGILSVGTGHCKAGEPNAYANVAKYRSFITLKTGL